MRHRLTHVLKSLQFEFTFLRVVFLKALGSSPNLCQAAATLGWRRRKAWVPPQGVDCCGNLVLTFPSPSSRPVLSVGQKTINGPFRGSGGVWCYTQQETTVLLQATRPPRAPIRVSLKVALISVRVLLATNIKIQFNWLK